MKTEELIALALAGIAVFLIVKSGKAATWVSDWKAAKEVLNNGQRYDNGWRYFNDGTSIDPQGNYYQGGQIIWSPSK